MDDLESKYKAYTAKRDKAIQNKVKIETTLAERKKNLKEAMDECKKAGYNPDTLAEDLKKLKEILLVKISIAESDLNIVDEQINNMMKEIE